MELQVPYMLSKTIAVEKPYSKADVAKAKKLVEEVREAKKNPEFSAFLREFINYHTGLK